MLLMLDMGRVEAAPTIIVFQLIFNCNKNVKIQVLVIKFLKRAY